MFSMDTLEYALCICLKVHSPYPYYLSLRSGTRDTASKFVSYVLEHIMHSSWLVILHERIHNADSYFDSPT